MLYGEVFASDIDPPCSENPNQRQCVAGEYFFSIRAIDLHKNYFLLKDTGLHP